MIDRLSIRTRPPGRPGAKMAASEATGRGRLEGLTPPPEEGPVT
jgi:hypothetical protein